MSSAPPRRTGIRWSSSSRGTLYPDVVGSGGGEGAANIKSHHNVGGLPEDLQFTLVEPLRALFRTGPRRGPRARRPRGDRLAAARSRPGLGIRIVRAVTADRSPSCAGPMRSPRGRPPQGWTAPSGSARSCCSPTSARWGPGRRTPYGHPVVLRPVSSRDAMTADWTRVPYDVLARISSRITNEVREVNRVVLDVTNKPPAPSRVGVAASGSGSSDGDRPAGRAQARRGGARCTPTS